MVFQEFILHELATEKDGESVLQVRLQFEGGQVIGKIPKLTMKAGAQIRILPAGKTTTLSHEIVFKDGRALVQMDKPQEFSDGMVICTSSHPVEVADQFNTQVSWSGSEPLLAGRDYEFGNGTMKLTGSITNIKYRNASDSDSHLAATQLESGETGICTISLKEEIAFRSYDENAQLGFLHIINPQTGKEVGECRINFALRRASNIHYQPVDLTKSMHASQKAQAPFVLWFTGLSGSGKSTVANALEMQLFKMGKHTYLLDGDNVRHGLNKDLGFTDADRVENIRRICEVTKLMSDAGLIVLTSFISPFQSERHMAREMMEEGGFVEIYVDAPLEVCETRDAKGLYAKARAGNLANFTGIDSPYEAPENPEITIKSASLSPQDAADNIIKYLEDSGRLAS